MTHPMEKVERNKKLYGEWKAGKSYNELARQYRMSLQNVARIIKLSKRKYD